MSSDEKLFDLSGDWATKTIPSDGLLGGALILLKRLISHFPSSSFPKSFSNHWLYELRRILSVLNNGESVKDEDAAQLYCCVYLLVSSFEFENEETGLFNSSFVEMRESLPASYVKILLQAEMVLVSNVLNGIKASSDFDCLSRYIAGIDKVDARLKEIEGAEARTLELSKQLDKQEIAFNFVGLYKGFHSLWVQKRRELCWQKAWLITLGCCVVAPLVIKLIYTLVVLGGEKTNGAIDMLSEQNITLLVTLGALELVLIYFFRIMLHSVNSTKAQLLQIDLRRTLCRFIQKYSKCSKDMKDGNPNALEKFETLIFSGLVMQDDKLPSTFDGLEPIQKIFAGRAGKAGGPG